MYGDCLCTVGLKPKDYTDYHVSLISDNSMLLFQPVLRICCIHSVNDGW